MCAFRMWCPSSMVCCRFSLPSCRENMNARRACPFLGPETQTCNKHPIPPHPRPSGENIAAQTLKPWHLHTTTQNGGKLCSSSRFRGFLRIPHLCGVSQREALWQGRAFSLEPHTLCPSTLTLSSPYLCLSSNVNSMKLRVLFISQVQSFL